MLTQEINDAVDTIDKFVADGEEMPAHIRKAVVFLLRQFLLDTHITAQATLAKTTQGELTGNLYRGC